MAVRGSTAPAITSPLLAWPAKPTPRSTPLVTPDTGTFESFDFPSRNIPTDAFDPTRTSAKMKGKERAEPAEEVNTEDMGPELEEKKYRPPTKPLSPRQLGRIAQSFGIEVPSMPPGLSVGKPTARSLSPAGSSSGQPTRPSPFLLTVIPPISLLPPSTSSTGAESARRWRRGRLIPLQPTVGSMLVAIAREYGLPSTKGINLYIAQAPKRSSSTSSFSDTSDEPGPRISPATWTSLFASQVSSLSRSSTPTGSPRRTGQLFNRDPQSSSPLSAWSDVLPHPRAPFGASSSSARSTPTKLSVLDQLGPLTPSSLRSQSTSASAVIATIEFDIDIEEATWYTTLDASGRRRNLSTRSEGGVRELHLVSKANDARPRFLRDVDLNTASDQSCSTGDSSMIKTVDGSQDSEEPPSPPLREEHLLAPFELRPELGDMLDKRGSALVIGEQLDDLEKMMRQLSPREIRLTSPRELTPRMAAKVATLQFPPPLPPRHANRPAKSPLVNSFTDSQFPDSNKNALPPTSSRPAWPAVPYAKHSESPGSPQLDEYFKPPTRPSVDGNGPRKSSFSEETIKRMEMEREEREGSKPMSTEWKPRRPVRPPSPNISSGAHARTPSYSLSPELVSSLKSPSVGAPKSPEGEAGEKRRTRSNSISLKGLRASMSRSSNRSSKKDDREPVPDLPRESKVESRETYGLFRQPIESTSSFPGLEGRPSLSPSMTEFGSTDGNPTHLPPEVQSTASLPNKQSGMRRLFGGSLPFKNRSSSDTHTPTLSTIPPQPTQRASLKSRRNPSHDGANLTISPPIPESFQKADNGFSHSTTIIHEDGRNIHDPGNGPMTPPYRTGNGPSSPISPRNGKRKPVPGAAAGDLEYMTDVNAPNQAAAGLTGSVSFGSVASFVLDEAPKRRTRGQGEYR